MNCTAVVRSVMLGVVVAAAGCRVRPEAGVVRWAGEQHAAVHDGDVASKARLAELAARPHLYAIGPLEGLAGEITVLDGRATISTVRAGEFHHESGLDHGAAFLVWTHAAEWERVALPESVRTMADLESYMPEAARRAGVEAPLAFRIEGRVADLEYHVLGASGPGPRTFEEHEKAKVKGKVAGAAVRMVGFYSTEHRGVFTSGTSDVHAHFVTPGDEHAGHVEAFTLEPGAALWVARRGS